MKVFKGLTNLFKESDDDDELLEEGYLEEEYDFEEEKPKKEKSKRSIFGSKNDSEYDDTSSATPSYQSYSSRANKDKVVPINASVSKGMRLAVIHPETMEDAKEITDTLLTGKSVVLNLEGVHIETAQRIIDYSAGSVYAMRGNFEKITNYIFLVTPADVDISGDIQKVFSIGIDLGGRNSNYQF